MDLMNKDYKLIIQSQDIVLSKSESMSMIKAIKNLLTRLKEFNALGCLNSCEFVDTMNPFTGETLTKRFVVSVAVPNTTFTIKKMSKGSINREVFVSNLNNIKEKYYD